MNRDDVRFDTRTQGFLVNRWDTELGQRVLAELVEGIKASVEIRGILDPYTLAHPDNHDSYGYPYYPPDAMVSGSFWVLNSDDLRGTRFYNEDFSGTKSLEVKMLAYARFYNCNLSDANLERSSLSFATFEHCDLQRTCFAASGGFDTRISSCQAQEAVLWETGMRGWDVRGTDWSDAYLEGALLEDLKLNHQTRFDVTLRSSWSTRTLPDAAIPDVLREIRLGYERAELWSQMDEFLCAEKRAHRKYILWQQFRNKPSLASLRSWAGSAVADGLSFYGTSPWRVIELQVLVVLLFALTYWYLDTTNAGADARVAIPAALLLSFSKLSSLGLLAHADDLRAADAILFVIEGLTGAVLGGLFSSGPCP